METGTQERVVVRKRLCKALYKRFAPASSRPDAVRYLILFNDCVPEYWAVMPVVRKAVPLHVQQERQKIIPI